MPQEYMVGNIQAGGVMTATSAAAAALTTNSVSCRGVFIQNRLWNVAGVTNVVGVSIGFWDVTLTPAAFAPCVNLLPGEDCWMPINNAKKIWVRAAGTATSAPVGWIAFG